MNLFDSIRKAFKERTMDPTPDAPAGEAANAQVQVTYVLNRGSKRLHALVGGRSFESCNVDDIPPAFRGEYASLDDLRSEVDIVAVKPCRRCFPNGLEG